LFRIKGARGGVVVAGPVSGLALAIYPTLMTTPHALAYSELALLQNYITADDLLHGGADGNTERGQVV
jgi:hypothetical protein